MSARSNRGPVVPSPLVLDADRQPVEQCLSGQRAPGESSLSAGVATRNVEW